MGEGARGAVLGLLVCEVADVAEFEGQGGGLCASLLLELVIP